MSSSYVVYNLNLDYKEDYIDYMFIVHEEGVNIFAFFFFFLNHHKTAAKAAVKSFFVAQGKTQTTMYVDVCYEHEILTWRNNISLLNTVDKDLVSSKNQNAWFLLRKLLKF